MSLKEGKDSKEESPGEQPGSPSCGAKEEYSCISSGFVIGSWEAVSSLCSGQRGQRTQVSETKWKEDIAGTPDLGGRAGGWFCACLRLTQVITMLSFLPVRVCFCFFFF